MVGLCSVCGAMWHDVTLFYVVFSGVYMHPCDVASYDAAFGNVVVWCVYACDVM